MNDPSEPVREAETLAALRTSMLALISATSEDRWCAGWMGGIEEELYAEGGIWEILGREVGWPNGYDGATAFAWLTWDEAGQVFAERKEGTEVAAALSDSKEEDNE